MEIIIDVIRDSSNTMRPPGMSIKEWDDDSVQLTLTDPDRSVVVNKADLRRAIQALESI